MMVSIKEQKRAMLTIFNLQTYNDNNKLMTLGSFYEENLAIGFCLRYIRNEIKKDFSKIPKKNKSLADLNFEFSLNDILKKLELCNDLQKINFIIEEYPKRQIHRFFVTNTFVVTSKKDYSFYLKTE
jgi:hypothetical protein